MEKLNLFVQGAFWGTIIGLLTMCWIVFAAQYYHKIGVIVDEERFTSTDACPAYINTTSLISTTTYSIFAHFSVKINLSSPLSELIHQQLQLLNHSFYIEYLVSITH